MLTAPYVQGTYDIQFAPPMSSCDLRSWYVQQTLPPDHTYVDVCNFSVRVWGDDASALQPLPMVPVTVNGTEHVPVGCFFKNVRVLTALTAYKVLIETSGVMPFKEADIVAAVPEASDVHVDVPSYELGGRGYMSVRVDFKIPSTFTRTTDVRAAVMDILTGSTHPLAMCMYGPTRCRDIHVAVRKCPV
jgi:hypothetical protein